MKLGLEHLNIEQPEVIITEEQMLQAQLEYIQANNEVTVAVQQLDSLVTSDGNLKDIINTIKTHGITDVIVALLGEELNQIEAFVNKDSEAVVATLEGVMADTGKKVLEVIKALIAKIKEMFKKFINLFSIKKKKIEEKVKKVKAIKTKKVWENPDLEIPDFWSQEFSDSEKASDEVLKLISKMITEVSSITKESVQEYKTNTEELKNTITKFHDKPYIKCSSVNVEKALSLDIKKADRLEWLTVLNKIDDVKVPGADDRDDFGLTKSALMLIHNAGLQAMTYLDLNYNSFYQIVRNITDKEESKDEPKKD